MKPLTACQPLVSITHVGNAIFTVDLWLAPMVLSVKEAARCSPLLGCPPYHFIFMESVLPSPSFSPSPHQLLHRFLQMYQIPRSEVVYSYAICRPLNSDSYQAYPTSHCCQHCESHLSYKDSSIGS